MNRGRDEHEGPEADTFAAGAIEESGTADTQMLLDTGYEQLDRFLKWLEESAGVDTRTAQQDCYNAESLIDFLANYHHKPATDINEYELRWFVFSHYIRKSIADRETEERLPDSLTRFFTFMQTDQSWDLPDWASATLEDREYYILRRAAFHALDSEDEADWKAGFQDWCMELEDDLDLRCLWLPREMGEDMAWNDLMGWREATLHSEANDQWQRERAALIADGLQFDLIRERLTSSYLIWIDTPQLRLDGQSPREIIHAERVENPMSEQEQDDYEEDER